MPLLISTLIWRRRLPVRISLPQTQIAPSRWVVQWSKWTNKQQMFNQTGTTNQCNNGNESKGSSFQTTWNELDSRRSKCRTSTSSPPVMHNGPFWFSLILWHSSRRPSCCCLKSLLKQQNSDLKVGAQFNHSLDLKHLSRNDSIQHVNVCNAWHFFFQFMPLYLCSKTFTQTSTLSLVGFVSW